MNGIRAIARDRVIRMTGMDIKSEYVRSAPSPQHAFDIFAGEWASRFPTPYDKCLTGDNPLFEDPRIAWLVDRVGDMGEMDVLECGPLEGAHTRMLELAGARSITAVEANTRAFLRCLVTKELFALSRSRFLLGDFVDYLREDRRFDLVVSCGVLYHLSNPVEALALAARATDRLYLWTHYYEDSAIRGNLSLSLRFRDKVPHVYDGFAHTLHRQNYQTKLGNPAFFGGAEDHSCWLGKDDLLRALEHVGFNRIHIHFDRVEGASGPSISLLACREPRS